MLRLFLWIFFCELENLSKHVVYLHVFITVDTRNDGCLVEWRKRIVYFLQFSLDFFLVIDVTLVSDVIYSTKDETFIPLVRSILLLANDINTAKSREAETVSAK